MSARDLRAKLAERTSWSKQVISARVQQLQKVTPMSTLTAQAVLAYRSGIRIDRYLNADEVRQVRDVLPEVAAADHAPHLRPAARPVDHVARSRNPRRRGSSDESARTVVCPPEFRATDPILPDVVIKEAREMAAIYPILYVLENSIRELVRRVMAAKYGDDWWNTALMAGKVKQLKHNSDVRRAKEDQMRWHQRRGAHPIDYVDLSDLGDIVIAKHEDFFPTVLGDTRHWFEQFMRELEPSRNVLCHMNPLDSTNVRDVQLKAERWRKLVAGQLGAIPAR
jgi:hypothetical protein